MKKNPVTIIVIRILAIYLFARSMMDMMPLTLASAFWESTNLSIADLFLLIFWLSTSLFGIVLWILAPGLARRLVPESRSSETRSSQALTETGFIRAGTFLIGIYWFLGSAAIFFGQLLGGGGINYGYAIVLLVSIFLVLQGNRVVQLYSKMKTFGSDR